MIELETARLLEIEVKPGDSPIETIAKELLKVFSGHLAYYSEPDKNENLKIHHICGEDIQVMDIYQKRYLKHVEGWVFESRAPLIISDTSRDPRFLIHYEEAFPPTSILSFPVLWKEKVLGIISIHRKPDKTFDADSINKIQYISRWAGRLLKNEINAQKSLQMRKELRLLSRLNQNSPHKKNADDLLQMACNIIKEELDTGDIEYMLLDEKFDLQSIPEKIRKILLRKIPGLIDTGKGPESLIIPTTFRDKLFAYIQIENWKPKEFADFAKTLGETLGKSLNRIRMENEVFLNNREMEALKAIADFEMSGIFAYTSDLPSILDTTLELIVKLLKVERVNIMLYNQEFQELQSQAYWGIDEKPFGCETLKLGIGLAGHALAVGKPFQKRKDVDVFVESPPGQPEIKALLAYPMIIDSRKIGVINVGSIYQDKVFSEEEIRIVSLIASRAALAIENSILNSQHQLLIREITEKNLELEKKTWDQTERGKRLSVTTRRLQESLQKEKKVSERLSNLYRFTREISGSLEPNHIMENALSYIMEVLSNPTRISAITIFDESIGRYKVKVSKGLPQRYKDLLEFRPTDLPESVVSPLTIDKIPLIVPRIRENEDVSKLRMAKGLNSFYAFPLFNKEQTFGALILASTREGALKTEDIEFLSTVTNQISMALSNAQHHQELKIHTEKMTVLNSLVVGFARATDLQDRLDTILKASCKILDHQFSAFILYDQWGNMQIKATYNLPAGFKTQLNHPEITAITDEVAERNHIYYSSSDFEDLLKRYSLLRKTGIKSLVILPLQTKEKKIGALILGDESPKYHTRQMLEFYRLLSVRLALIIDNALLFSKIVLEKDRMESVFESMNEGVVSIDWEKKITNFNRTASEITGWNEEEVLGKPCYSIFTCWENAENEDKQCPEVCPLTEILNQGEKTKKGEGHRSEGKIQTREGAKRDISVVSSLLSQEGKPVGGVLVFHDITEEKEFQARRSDYLAAISHDIFTPLTAIKGYVSTLLTHRDKFDASTQQEFIKITNSEIDRITRLLYNLMSLSRMETDRLQAVPAPHNLYNMVDKIVDLYSLSTRNHKMVVDEKIKEMPQIYADGDHVEQILNNLLSNAIKYSPVGGDIEISAQKTDDFVKVTVRDHGIGIQKENLEKIFDRYQRVINKDSRLVSGMGLGLFITRALVHMQGGRIWAANCQDGGTKFIFTLPIYDEEKVRQQKESE